MLLPYSPEALTDFSQPGQQEAFRAALNIAAAGLGRTFPLIIGGKAVATPATYASINPSRPAEVIGHFAKGDAQSAADAITAATAAFETWQHTPVSERVRYLLHAAAELRRRKHEFSAVMVYEVGKSWAEADADTSEAIDFLEYYARQAMRLLDSSDQLAPYPAEQLSLTYIPLGVGAIIPPWNFALAIPMGMVAATLVTGNTIILKPAGQSPYIAWLLCELFWNAGLPAGVLNFVTGPGSVVGSALVNDPRTRFINFTGSREVGCQIYEQMAKVQPGQKWLKRATLEMGGKDAVLVDETANAEAAARTRGLGEAQFAALHHRDHARQDLILPADFRSQHFIQFAEAFELLNIKSCCIHGLQSCQKHFFTLFQNETKQVGKSEKMSASIGGRLRHENKNN